MELHALRPLDVQNFSGLGIFKRQGVVRPRAVNDYDASTSTICERDWVIKSIRMIEVAVQLPIELPVFHQGCSSTPIVVCHGPEGIRSPEANRSVEFVTKTELSACYGSIQADALVARDIDKIVAVPNQC